MSDKIVFTPVGLDKRLANYLEGPGQPLKITQRRDMNGTKAAKTTNSEIVKALVVITQDFYNHNPGPQPEEMPEAWGIVIDETNLVDRISMALNAYRRQKDRMADLMNQMERIVSGE